MVNVVDWSFLAVLLLSLKVEKWYVSRPAIVANTVSIFVSTVHHWDSVPVFLQGYAVVGVFLRVRSISQLSCERVAWMGLLSNCVPAIQHVLRNPIRAHSWFLRNRIPELNPTLVMHRAAIVRH